MIGWSWGYKEAYAGITFTQDYVYGKTVFLRGAVLISYVASWIVAEMSLGGDSLVVAAEKRNEL
jgi:hypothetical protein